MFTTKLRVEPIRGSTYRSILSDLVFKDSIYGKLMVPQGFLTDYASIPSVIPRWFIDQDDPLIREASVLHDYLYSKDCIYFSKTRAESDAIFYRAMLSLCAGVGDVSKATVAYLSVRIAGTSHFRK